MSGDGDRWSLLVPVKRLDLAKTRLGLGRPSAPTWPSRWRSTPSPPRSRLPSGRGRGRGHRRRRAPRRRWRRRAPGSSADEPDAGLNPALRHGAAVGRRRLGSPRCPRTCPRCAPTDLEAVLARRPRHHARAVVADASGTGTTLLAARRRRQFAPAFGDGLVRAHRARGRGRPQRRALPRRCVTTSTHSTALRAALRARRRRATRAARAPRLGVAL